MKSSGTLFENVSESHYELRGEIKIQKSFMTYFREKSFFSIVIVFFSNFKVALSSADARLPAAASLLLKSKNWSTKISEWKNFQFSLAHIYISDLICLSLIRIGMVSRVSLSHYPVNCIPSNIDSNFNCLTPRWHLISSSSLLSSAFWQVCGCKLSQSL